MRELFDAIFIGLWFGAAAVNAIAAITADRVDRHVRLIAALMTAVMITGGVASLLLR